MVFHKNFIPSLEDDDLILSKLSDYNNQLSHIFKSKKAHRDSSVGNLESDLREMTRGRGFVCER